MPGRYLVMLDNIHARIYVARIKKDPQETKIGEKKARALKLNQNEKNRKGSFRQVIEESVVHVRALRGQGGANRAR